MPSVIRITDETTVADIDAGIVKLLAADVGSDPVRHEVPMARVDVLLEHRTGLTS